MHTKTYGKKKLTPDQMFSTRAEAKDAGHVHYYTATPCQLGHDAPRYVSNGRCVACQGMASYGQSSAAGKTGRLPLTEAERRLKRKKYRQQYWLDNKERLSKLHTEWYRKNRKKENERDRKRYQKNREKVIERVKTYYHENRERILEKKRQYRANHKDVIREQNRQYYLKKKKEREAAQKSRDD